MPKNLVTITGLHQGNIRAIACTPKCTDDADGIPLLISGGEDRNLNLSDALTGDFIKRIPAFTGRPGHPGHRDKIYAIAIWNTKTEAFIVSTGDDRLIRVFRLDDIKPVRTMEGHSDYVHTLQIIDSLSHAVTASYDRTVRIWDLYAGEELHQFRQDKVLFALDFCVNSLSHFATGSANYIKIWDVEDWKPDERSKFKLELRSHTRTVTALAYPRVDKLISGSDDAHICIWNPEEPESPLIQKLSSQSPVYSMKWFDDGLAFLLVTAHWGKDRKNYAVRIWNLTPKEKERPDDESSEEYDTDEERPPKEMTYCYLIDSGLDHTASVVNLCILDDGKPHIVKEKRKKGEEDDLDIKRIVSVSLDGTIRTWDLRPAIEVIHRVKFLADAQTSRMF